MELEGDISFSAADIEALDFTSDGETPNSSASVLLPSLPPEGAYCSSGQSGNEPIFSNSTLELSEYAGVLSQNMTIASLEAHLGLNKSPEATLGESFAQGENGLDSELESIAQSVQKSAEGNSYENLTKDDGSNEGLKSHVANSSVLGSDTFDVDTLFLHQQDLHTNELTVNNVSKPNVITIPVSDIGSLPESSVLDMQAPVITESEHGKILTDQSTVNIDSFSPKDKDKTEKGDLSRPHVSCDGLLGVSSILSPPTSVTTLSTTANTMTELQTVAAQDSVAVNVAADDAAVLDTAAATQPAQTISSVTVSKISDNTTIVKVSFLPTTELGDPNSLSFDGQNIQFFHQDISNPMQVIMIPGSDNSVNKLDLSGVFPTQGEQMAVVRKKNEPKMSISMQPDTEISDSQTPQGNAIEQSIDAQVLDVSKISSSDGATSIAQGCSDNIAKDISHLIGSAKMTGEGAHENTSEQQAICHDRMELNVTVDESQCIMENGQRRWKCKLCEKAYTTKHNLVTHILGHSGIKPHCCMVCGKFFKQMSHLNTHMLIHENIRPHMCEICRREFTQASHVKRHMAVHMEHRPYVCDICDRGFAYPSELKSHAEKHKRSKENTCEQCGKGFETQKKLKAHKKSAHKKIEELTCGECGKVYTYPSQLRDHMVKHSASRPFMCAECGMEFMKEHHLKAHQFTHTGLKPWKCSVCRRPFNQKANLLRHMLVHEEEKKHKCEVCGRSFTQLQTLKAHRITHSEKKPHQCRICGKEFGRLHNLQGHMHMHQDSKPHLCYCGASFTLKGNLTRHRKVKHGITDSSECTEEEAAKILNSMSGKRPVSSMEDNTNLNNPERTQSEENPQDESQFKNVLPSNSDKMETENDKKINKKEILHSIDPSNGGDNNEEKLLDSNSENLQNLASVSVEKMCVDP